LLFYVYGFFIANVLLFYALFKVGAEPVYVARAFFIWISVFNLFVVSVFWSFMADLFSSAQARRLFGFIAAGGSAGAIVGPLMTVLLAPSLGPVNLLLVSAALLGITMLCIHRLSRWDVSKGRSGAEQNHATARSGDAQAQTRALGGGVLSGIRAVVSSWYLAGIGLFIWLYTTLATFLYFTQAHLISQAFDDPAQRTTLFASIDLGVNTLTLFVQLFVTGRIIHLLGLPRTLALVPAFLLLGFLALGLMPVLSVLIGIQVLRRSGNYALARPAREVLFTVIDREAKYKAKNFIDTVVYRGGDAISGWVYVALQALGLSLSGIAYIALPVAMLWLITAFMLGLQQEKLSRAAMLKG
jgi:AAA family ATP:ADP antiporter